MTKSRRDELAKAALESEIYENGGMPVDGNAEQYRFYVGCQKGWDASKKEREGRSEMKPMDDIMQTLKATDNEGTESPWWMVIDPEQIHGMLEGVAEHGEVPDSQRITTTIAFSVEGPFFCRKDAEDYLKARHYAYSQNAIVWCGSGYRSQKYRAFCREIRATQP